MTSTTRGHVYVAGTTRQEISNLLPFANVLAKNGNNALRILGLVNVLTRDSLSTAARPAQKLRQQLEPLSRKWQARIIVRVGHEPWKQVEDEIGEEAGAYLVVSWTSPLPATVLRSLPCNIVMLQGEFPPTIKRILLPIRGGPYAAIALSVALAFADTHRAEITLLHAAPAARLLDPQYRDFFHRLRTLPQITKLDTPTGDVTQAIVERATPDQHQIVVLGAIANPQPGDPPIGPTALQVAQQSQSPVLIVKSPVEMPALIPPVDYTISVIVDKWFAENTFHAHEFADLKRLTQMKEKQGVTISLGLPALDEEKTIGKVIKTVRTAFMQRYPLLDEIVVIDSNSSDRTVAIAQDLGVPVFRHSELLPAHGSKRGKGEALWKSLYVLEGDIIAWIDTDIVNIHPRFVYGILGPLIQEPRLKYVKGFYQRPLRMGRKLEARGGGRVTELVVRPMLNLFYPELSGFVQPLAGEYAGRRDALESVPFFTGYGVETGLLIDMLKHFDLPALGQVDLAERVHRNQSLLALSRMAFAIIQVLMQRVGERHNLALVDAMNATLKLIQYDRDRYHLDVTEIHDEMRPPMIEVPEYRAKRGSAPKAGGADP